MTFTQFLRTKIKEDSPVGDFAADWCSDRKHPYKIKDHGDLVYYLRTNNACEGTVIAGLEAYEQWRNLDENSK